MLLRRTASAGSRSADEPNTRRLQIWQTTAEHPAPHLEDPPNEHGRDHCCVLLWCSQDYEFGYTAGGCYVGCCRRLDQGIYSNTGSFVYYRTGLYLHVHTAVLDLTQRSRSSWRSYSSTSSSGTCVVWKSSIQTLKRKQTQTRKSNSIMNLKRKQKGSQRGPKSVMRRNSQKSKVSSILCIFTRHITVLGTTL